MPDHSMLLIDICNKCIQDTFEAVTPKWHIMKKVYPDENQDPCSMMIQDLIDDWKNTIFYGMFCSNIPVQILTSMSCEPGECMPSKIKPRSRTLLHVCNLKPFSGISPPHNDEACLPSFDPKAEDDSIHLILMCPRPKNTHLPWVRLLTGMNKLSHN